MATKSQATPERIGELIRVKREKLSMNRETLAVKAGIGITTLSNIENGYGIPRKATLQKIADVLGIRLPDMVIRIRN